MANKIELKWYEKKQGIHIKQKISAEQKKIDADEKQRRKLEEKNNSEKQLKCQKIKERTDIMLKIKANLVVKVDE